MPIHDAVPTISRSQLHRAFLLIPTQSNKRLLHRLEAVYQLPHVPAVLALLVAIPLCGAVRWVTHGVATVQSARYPRGRETVQ